MPTKNMPPIGYSLRRLEYRNILARTMAMTPMLQVVLAFSLCAIVLGEKQHLRRLANTGEFGSVLCRVTIVHTVFDFDLETARKGEQISCIPIIDGEESDNIWPVSLPSQVTSKYWSDIEHGKLFVNIHGASDTNKGLIVAENATFAVNENPSSHLRRLHERHLTTTGTISVSLVRISTSDSSPTASAADIQNYVFSSETSPMTQYSACSFGQFTWTPAPTGIIDVKIDQPVSSFASYMDLITAAQDKIKSYLKISSMTSLADKVVMCLPPGTGDWAGSAGIGHWRAQLNNRYCKSLSAYMHEVGHTIGLFHSSKFGREYADMTCFMAAGHPDSSYPKKCFNGQKNWSLGWYSKRQLAINPLTESEPQLIELAAFVDYDTAETNQPVLINVDNIYYLQYNRLKGFNYDNEDLKNQVTITQDLTDVSDNRGGILPGQQVQVNNFKSSGRALVIHACQSIEGPPDVMLLSIGMDASACPSTKPSSGPASSLSTGLPSANPVNVPSKTPSLRPTTAHPTLLSEARSASLSPVVSDPPSLTPTATTAPVASAYPSSVPSMSRMRLTPMSPTVAPSGLAMPSSSDLPSTVPSYSASPSSLSSDSPSDMPSSYLPSSSKHTLNGKSEEEQPTPSPSVRQSIKETPGLPLPIDYLNDMNSSSVYQAKSMPEDRSSLKLGYNEPTSFPNDRRRLKGASR